MNKTFIYRLHPTEFFYADFKYKPEISYVIEAANFHSWAYKINEVFHTKVSFPSDRRKKI